MAHKIGLVPLKIMRFALSYFAIALESKMVDPYHILKGECHSIGGSGVTSYLIDNFDRDSSVEV